jgi:hypothetical protein
MFAALFKVLTSFRNRQNRSSMSQGSARTEKAGQLMDLLVSKAIITVLPSLELFKELGCNLQTQV